MRNYRLATQMDLMGVSIEDVCHLSMGYIYVDGDLFKMGNFIYAVDIQETSLSGLPLPCIQFCTWEDESIELKDESVKQNLISAEGFYQTDFSDEMGFSTAIQKSQKDLTDGMVFQKEEIFKEAVEHVLGENYKPEDIKMAQGTIHYLPNKIEQFWLSGKLLLEFYPVEFEFNKKTIGAKQNYRKFYEPVEQKE